MAGPEPADPGPDVLAEVTVVFRGTVLGVEHIARASRAGGSRVYTLGEGPDARFQVPGEGLPVPEGTPIVRADDDGVALVLVPGLCGELWSERRRCSLAEAVSSRPWVTRKLDTCTGCRIDLGATQVWIRGVAVEAAAVEISPIERAPIVTALVVGVLFFGMLALLQHLAPEPLRPVKDDLLTEMRYISCGYGEEEPSPVESIVLGEPRALQMRSGVASQVVGSWAGEPGQVPRLEDRLARPDASTRVRVSPGEPFTGSSSDSSSVVPAPAAPGELERYVPSPWIATDAHTSVALRPAPVTVDPIRMVHELRRGRPVELDALADPAELMSAVAPERPHERGEALALAVESADVEPGHTLVRAVVVARGFSGAEAEPEIIAHDMELVARFDPAVVAAFRPVGHRPHVLDEGAAPWNDAPADLMPGRVIVALYELELIGEPPPGTPLVELEARYRPTADAPPTQRRITAMHSAVPLEHASAGLRLASMAAEVSELLGSARVTGHDFDRVLPRAIALADELGSPRARELVDLLRFARP